MFSGRLWTGYSFSFGFSALGDRSNRAAACASAATDAHILIDCKLTTVIGDRTYRAGSCTCTTADTSITNYKCHSLIPPYWI